MGLNIHGIISSQLARSHKTTFICNDFHLSTWGITGTRSIKRAQVEKRFWLGKLRVQGLRFLIFVLHEFSESLCESLFTLYFRILQETHQIFICWNATLTTFCLDSIANLGFIDFKILLHEGFTDDVQGWCKFLTNVSHSFSW